MKKDSIQDISVLENYRKTGIVIIFVYIPPNCTNEATFSTLGSCIDEIFQKPNTKHILCGDLNINFFYKGKKNNKLISTLSAIGLSLLCHHKMQQEKPISQKRYVMFFKNFKLSQKVLNIAVSDHYTIKLIFSENTKFSNKKCNKIRVWSKLKNTDTLNQIRAKIVCYSYFLLKKKINSINCNESLIQFHDFLNIELNNIIPEKTHLLETRETGSTTK